jgi:hypothetical protein
MAMVEPLPLADGVDLCESCASAFLDWLRSGNPNLANHAAPGGAMADTTVASRVKSVR